MKKSLVFFLVLVMMFSLVACGKTTNTEAPATSNSTEEAESPEALEAPEASEFKPIEVSLSTPHPEVTIMAQKVQWFADQVYELTDGKIKINVFYNNSLGSQKDMFTSLANNELELIMDGTVSCDYYAPEYGFLSAPLLITGQEHMQNLIDSEIWMDFTGKLLENNIGIIGTCLRPSRELLTTVEITDPDDLSGLVIRLPDNATYIAAWQALGASVQVLGGAEVYSSMQTGVINSAEGPWDQQTSLKLEEVGKYLYPTNHTTEFGCIYVSEEWLNSLPDDLKDIVASTANEAFAEATTLGNEAAQTKLQVLKDAGLVYIDTLDFSGMYNLCKPLWQEKFNSGEWIYDYETIMGYATK